MPSGTSALDLLEIAGVDEDLHGCLLSLRAAGSARGFFAHLRFARRGGCGCPPCRPRRSRRRSARRGGRCGRASGSPGSAPASAAAVCHRALRRARQVAGEIRLGVGVPDQVDHAGRSPPPRGSSAPPAGTCRCGVTQIGSLDGRSRSPPSPDMATLRTTKHCSLPGAPRRVVRRRCVDRRAAWALSGFAGAATRRRAGGRRRRPRRPGRGVDVVEHARHFVGRRRRRLPGHGHRRFVRSVGAVAPGRGAARAPASSGTGMRADGSAGLPFVGHALRRRSSAR